MTLICNEATVLGSARDRLNKNLKAEAFWDIQGSLRITLIDSMAQLAFVVVTPREKLGVAALSVLQVRAGSATAVLNRSVVRVC